jgi:hypothetical protein
MKDPIRPIEKLFPELYTVAKKIARETAISINHEAKLVESKMPYKAQAILEMTIQLLQEKV